MTTQVQSFLDGSSSFLQVTKPIKKAWMSLNFGKIPSLTSEIAALERLKSYEKCCEHSSSIIFNLIFYILAGNKDNHKISDGFEIRSYPLYVYNVRMLYIICIY